MRSQLVLGLLISLLLLAGCTNSASLKSSGSENGARSQMLLGLPF
jgi:hypothetical protein